MSIPTMNQRHLLASASASVPTAHRNPMNEREISGPSCRRGFYRPCRRLLRRAAAKLNGLQGACCPAAPLGGASDLDLETEVNFRRRFPASQAPIFPGNFIENDLDVISWNSYFSEAMDHRLIQIAFGLKRTAKKGTYGDKCVELRLALALRDDEAMRLMCEQPHAPIILRDLEAFNQRRLHGFDDLTFLLRRIATAYFDDGTWHGSVR